MMVNEKEKAANFKRLALGRTNKVLKGLSLLANLTDSGYVSTQDDRNEITNTIQEGLNILKQKYKPKTLTLQFKS